MLYNERKRRPQVLNQILVYINLLLKHRDGVEFKAQSTVYSKQYGYTTTDDATHSAIDEFLLSARSRSLERTTSIAL